MSGARLRRAPRLLRRPEADLARLPVGLDLRALNLLEGLRAALSVAVVVALNEYLSWPPMAEAALAAWLTCLCDQGGPIRRRLPAVLSFTVLGAAVTVAAGFARAGGLYIAVPFAMIGLFCCGFARVYGQSALVVGNLLSVSFVLAIDRPLPDAEAGLMVALGFLGGGCWAALLTMVVWRMRPFLPARRAVANVYLALAALAKDLHSRIRCAEQLPGAWEEHARAHRREVRDAIEQARAAVLDTVRVRGGGRRGAQSLIRLEAADQIFDVLIAVSELLEQGRPADLAAGQTLLRRLWPLLSVLGRTIRSDSTRPNRQIAGAIDGLQSDLGSLPADSALRRPGDALVERLRIALTLNVAASYLPGAGNDGTALPWRTRVLAPLRGNLSWNSLALRHALRVGLVAAPAVAITVIWYGPYERWLTITMVLTLQPQFALTMTRALERIGGTVLGGLFAAALSLICTTPVAIAVSMFPLAIIALAVRQVSFGAFITAVTPIVVLLSELGRPGTSELQIALIRALFTLIGGLLALAGALLLWPTWEPSRLPAEIRSALAAHAIYVRAALGRLIGEAGPNEALSARRAAGMASNNLEASLGRVLQEPRHISPEGLEAAMVIDASMRRIAGRLSAMQLEPAVVAEAERTTLARWRNWGSKSLDALASGEIELAPRPSTPTGPAGESLARMARQIELLAGAMARLPH